ncbi:MAG: hypothetical protein AB8H80_15460 [Planctomycetota bacterium]
MIRTSLSSPCWALLCFASALSAQGRQEPLKPQHFLFDECALVARLDMDALRKHEVWEDIESSPLNLVLGRMREAVGFVLEDLHGITAQVSVKPSGGDDDDGSDSERSEVVIFEGRKPLALPDHERNGDMQTIGGVEVFGSYAESRMVSIRTGNFAVNGYRAAVESVLEGERRAGLPSGEVLSLIADPRGLVGYVAVDVRYESPWREALREALATEWPEEDAPTHLCLRLRVIGDPDDPHLQLEAVLRHGKAGDGLATSERAVDAGIAKLLAMPESRMFRRVLKSVKRTRSGPDAVWTLDLGRSRNAAGLVGSLLPFLMVGRQSQGVVLQAKGPRQVQAVKEAKVLVEKLKKRVPVPPPPPPPPPAAAPVGGGGGGR